MRTMVREGFLFGLAKCNFLVASGVVLGFRVYAGEYRLGCKALEKLLEARIPTTLREL